MRTVLIFALVAAVGCARERAPFRVAVADPATRREPAAGAVLGGAGRYGSHAWLGIPYAEPPVGALRWRAPRPLARWDGTREALAFGAACAQYGSRLGGAPGVRPGQIGGSEDCLTLNVWAPPFAPDAVPRGAERLPVMVWIHGGGNTIGHAAFYDGGDLAVRERVVVVTAQYRLGPFGWFGHQAVRADAADEAEASGNFGTLDLVRALAWVHDNVAAFGGDPGNVTIFGESAGGLNVYTLLLAPQARGLFHRAIVESGGLWHYTPAAAEHDTDDAERGVTQSTGEIVLRLLERDGAASRAAAKERRAGMDDAALAGYLRGKSTRDLLAAYEPEPSGMIDMPRTVGDGAVLPSGDWLEHFARPDGWNRVPVILGTNKDENKLFMIADPRYVHRRLWILPRAVDASAYQLVAEYQARVWKATGADEPAAAMRRNWDRVFVYRFDWAEEPTLLGTDLSALLGAAHAFEIPFVFGHWDLGRRGNVLFTQANAPGREALSAAMMSYWTGFAYTGAPGRGRRGDAPEWTPWSLDAGAPTYVVLDTEAGGGIRMEGRPETLHGVLASVDADPRLQAQRDRCRIYHELADWGRGFTPRDYPNAGAHGCREYPFESYPWS